MPGKELEGIVAFFHLLEKLKLEKRKGWLNRGIKDCESVAEHSFRLALMAMVFGERKKLDVNKVVKMAIIHDLPEAICGDVATTPNDEKNLELQKEKHKREEQALEKVLAGLEGKIKEEIWKLWQEYEKKESEEAKLVFELDRLEGIFQAREYEDRKNFKVTLEEFYEFGNVRLRAGELKAVFEILMSERQQETGGKSKK